MTGIDITLILGAAVVAAVVGAFIVGRSPARLLRKEVDRLTSELSRTEGRTRDQSRTLARMRGKRRGEQRSVSNLARALPDVVRELNRLDLEPRSIPRILIHLISALFEPEQALLYLVRPALDENQPPKQIYLRAQRGFKEAPESIKRICIDEGKIGWVATHKVEMVAEDWLNLSRTEGRNVEDNDPLLHLDMIAPLVQHEGAKENLLGVLCVGRPAERSRDEKLMLQLIANLGALALMNARNVGKLAAQANHDGLTGLLNKRHFIQELGLLINAAESNVRPLGIFIFDIDHFKAYNDTSGHLAGDELLKTLAKMLRENLRPDDLACRYGGEEFVVAMPDSDADSAHKIADRIREMLASHPFPHGETQPGGRLTISGGVAAFPVDGTSGTELIGNADQALYQAKASGRNKVLRHRGVQIGDPSLEEGEEFPLSDEPQGTAEAS